ncbi:MAG: hypothetical protein KDA57_06335 [Planctomycetales bacterium]|nr:hypothetical protein [Planctomycetales bacterium]
MKSLALLIIAAMLSMAGIAGATTYTLFPTADGDVQTWGGDSIDTTDTRISLTQSGGLIRNGILEFDLSSIPDSATINSATLEFTMTSVVSNTGGNPAAIDIFAYNGDGVVDIADYAAAGTQVADTTIPNGGSTGDVHSFSLSPVAPVVSALSSDLLTLRIETDSFATFSFASLENTIHDAARLKINYVPEPTSAMLLGIAALVGSCCRTRQRPAKPQGV